MSIKSEPSEAYAKQVTLMLDKLTELRKFADSRFDALSPNKINWGHVGDLSRVISSLNDALAEAEDIQERH